MIWSDYFDGFEPSSSYYGDEPEEVEETRARHEELTALLEGGVIPGNALPLLGQRGA